MSELVPCPVELGELHLDGHVYRFRCRGEVRPDLSRDALRYMRHSARVMTSQGEVIVTLERPASEGSHP